jgi:hypothetical protein
MPINYGNNNVSTSGIITATSGNFTNLQVDSNNVWNLGNLPNAVNGTGVTNHIAYWNNSSGIVAGSGQLYWDSSNNRLGIGTVTPLSKLHVVGDITCDNIVPTDPGSTTMRVGSASAYVDLIDNVGIKGANVSLTYEGGAGGVINILTDNNISTLFISDDANNNNIGIGTTSPSSKLDINGNVNIDGNLTFDSYTESVVANGNSGTSKTLSLTSGTVHTCTLTGNCTFTMPTATAGKSFSMFLNSGSGNYTASFSGVRWADSATPTATITASKVDIYSFISDGTYWYGSFSQNYG